MQIEQIFDDATAASATLTALLWEPIALATATDAQLRADDTVLDACCGTGPFTIQAAPLVQWVDAVDCSSRSLAQLTAALPPNARVNIHHEDVLRWAKNDYSLVVCINGLQFFPDMTAAARQLADRARPGGRVVYVTWSGEGMTQFGMRAWNAIEGAKTGQYRKFVPSCPPAELKYLLTDPKRMHQWLDTAVGLEHVTVRVHRLALAREYAWTLVEGSAFRTMFTGLNQAQLRQARQFLERDLAQVEAIDCSFHVAVGYPAPS